MFDGIANNSYVYFVHSYYLKAEDENIVAASTEYSTHIHASVESGNIFACQFHPEKSSDIGLRIFEELCLHYNISNYIDWRYNICLQRELFHVWIVKTEEL